MIEKLLPCPFCGGEAELECFANPNYMYSVKCCSCPAEIGGWKYTSLDKNKNIEAVVDAWNQRVKEEQKCKTL